MNELIAKLAKQVEDVNARQSSALTAAEVEGVSPEDREKHLAEFDRLQGDKDKAQASLKRAQKLAKDQAEAEQPHTNPIVLSPHNPNRPTAGRLAIPATARRTRSLRAFKGADAELRAYQAGLWVAACLFSHGPSRQKLSEFGIEARQTMSGVDNNKAAYLVPDELDTEIIELTEQFGVIRRLADVEPMTSDTWTGPRWTGAMTAYWVAEGASPTQSEPGWDAAILVAKNLAAFGKMSVQLNEDALIDLGEKWAMAAAIAFAYAEDNAAFNGDGTSAYGGITGLFTKVIDAANSASLVTATGHTTLGALTLNDFWAAVGKFPNYPGAMPRWLCHKEVYATSMGPLQTAAGGITPEDIAAGGIPKFLGYPVEYVNVAPRASAVTTGVTGILFADLALAVKFGDRRQRTMRTGEVNDDMLKQLMTLFSAERVDINVHSVVDPKDSTKPGPVVGLKLG